MTARAPFVLLAVALLVGGVTAVSASGPDDGPPPLPAQPGQVALTLAHALPFVTQVPFNHEWRMERPSFDAGWLVVLQVADRDVLAPRQLAEPVLFGGAETLQRINTGAQSGYLVAVLPSARAGRRPLVDLGETPFFFGQPALPENVDAETARASLEGALAAGVSPPTAAILEVAVQSTVTFADLGDVQAHAADLIEHFSPSEADLVSGLRAVRLTR